MEVAAYLCGKAASVSCIDIAAVPFERVLGTRIGKMLQGVSGSMMSSFFSHCLSMRAVMSSLFPTESTVYILHVK